MIFVSTLAINSERHPGKNFDCFVKNLLPHFASFFLPSWKETSHRSDSDSIRKEEMQGQPIFLSQSFSLQRSSWHFWFHWKHWRNTRSYICALTTLPNHSGFLHLTPHFSSLFAALILLFCFLFLFTLPNQIFYWNLSIFLLLLFFIFVFHSSFAFLPFV